MALTARVSIEPMRFEDVSAVHEIERLSFATPWPAYAFEQELKANRLARYVVARAGDSIVGFAGVWLMVDDAHVTTFGVHPDWRRQGIGRQLMLNVSELSSAIGARRMTLEVRVSNVAAQELYRRFGFAPAGIRKGYYADTGEDAIVMWAHDIDSGAYGERLDAIAAEIPGRTTVEAA